MVVQIFEPCFGFHPTNYIEALLPTLTHLLEAKRIDKVVVTISQRHRDSALFDNQLSRFSSKVHFDASIPRFPHSAKFSFGIASALLDSVERHRPAYLVLTTADVVNLALAVSSSFRSNVLPLTLHSVGIFHSGYGGLTTNFRERIRDAGHRFSWLKSPWSEILMVNPLIYESLNSKGEDFRGRLGLAPNPMDMRPLVDTASARRLLGIPVEGRYIGSVGALDRRKALPEALAAFRNARSLPTDRFLIAGRVCEEYQRLIETHYSDLLQNQGLVLLDRFLREEELTHALCALDIAAVIYYPTIRLSLNLLAAASARRPVIADERGYTGMAINRFQLGWACDIRDQTALSSIMRIALSEAQEYQPTERLQRLLEFHSPTNFANRVFHALYEQIGLPPTPAKSWEWVNAGT